MDEKGILKVNALEEYFKIKKGEKKRIVSGLSESIAGACGKMPSFMDISTGHRGEIWNIKKGKASLMESRSYTDINAGGKMVKTGKWFASFGMQSMGGDNPSTGMNFRLGSMLYKNKYDLALTYNYNQQNYSLLSRKSLGLSARKLFPLTPHGGYNLGINLSRSDNYGETETRDRKSVV